MTDSAGKANKADILIVTVTTVESRAVLDAFKHATGQESVQIRVGERMYFDLGSVNGARVFMALSEMGTSGVGGAQDAVRLALEALHPAAVIMVGIAFGINQKKQAMGEILVAKQILQYELQRVGKTETLSRGDKPHASPKLINWLQMAALTWDENLAKVDFGLILSGEKLIDNLAFRKQVQAFAPDAIGGEMEGAGLYVACHNKKVDWILVKAICDWADGKKGMNKQANQALAAKNAVDFVLYAIQKLPIIESTILPPPPPSPPPPLLTPTKPTPTDPDVRMLLSLCDRAPLVQRVRHYVNTPNEPPVRLLCLLDHKDNLPQLQITRLQRVVEALNKNCVLLNKHTSERYTDSVANFGEIICASAGEANETALLEKLNWADSDLSLYLHSEDCTALSTPKVSALIKAAATWLARLPPLRGKLVLVLVLHYKTETPSPWAKLLRRPTTLQRVQKSWAEAKRSSPELTRLALGELLQLEHYSDQDFRDWLGEKLVETRFAHIINHLKDEKWLDRQFGNGKCTLTALHDLLIHHDIQYKTTGSFQ